MIASILAVFVAALQLSATPEISHERIGENHFRIRFAATGVSDLGQAQAALVPTAERLCSPLPARLGRYNWEASEQLENAAGARAPGSIILHQEVHCGATVPEVEEPAAAPDPNWQPGPADERAVTQATEAYFAARDSGRYEEAYGMLTLGRRGDTTLEGFTSRVRTFNERAGARRGRRIIRLTWYNSPPQAPVPGIYAAADYSADFANLHFVCGYLIWLLQPDGSWRVIREEENNFWRSDAPNATAEEMAGIRAQIGCRD